MSHDAYSALSDVTRRRILETLRGGPRPVGELVTELEVSQPTVSKHLKVLRDAGMVGTRAQGQKRFYSLRAQPLTEAVEWLETLVAAASTEQAEQPEQEQPEAPAAPRSVAAPAATAEPAVAEPEADLAQEAPSEPATVPGPEADVAQEAAAAPATDPEPEADAAHEAPAEPAREEPSERELPWFTAPVTEITGTGESDVVVAAGEGPQESPETDDTARESAEPDANEEAGGEVGADRAEAAPEQATESPRDESHVTGDTLDTDVHAGPADQPEAEDDAEPRHVAPSTAPAETLTSENAEQLRPRGGAHRRQSGLLSTLTGLRRRGRGARRD